MNRQRFLDEPANGISGLAEAWNRRSFPQTSSCSAISFSQRKTAVNKHRDMSAHPVNARGLHCHVLFDSLTSYGEKIIQ